MPTGPEGQLDTAEERLSGEPPLPVPAPGDAGKSVKVNAAENGYGLVATVATPFLGTSTAATTPGTVVKKIEVFGSNGVSLGFLAIYDAIT